jgi:hypothetical protein
MSKQDGGPAFPFTPVYEHDESPGSPYCITYSGMSLRDWFAGQALVGLSANASVTARYQTALSDDVRSKFAEFSYKMADAMLAARDAS